MADEVIQRIEECLGPEVLLSNSQLSERYPHIWHMDESLLAKGLAVPRSTEEVSSICKICHEFGQSIVVHGGLTGLVGSTHSTENDLVISLEKLNDVIEIDSAGRTVTVGAGVILEDVLRIVEERDLFFPLNFGARGSAQIGGCIATNAGGLRVVRYGMISEMVLGLEVVLADGTILSSLKKLIKDNSGYKLNQLFIGSEGTLGIVTKAVLRLQEKPLSRNSAFISFEDFDHVVEFLKFSDKSLSGQLSGFEIIWGDTYKAITSPPSHHKAPLTHGSPYYVLLETLGNDPDRDQDRLSSVIEQAITSQMAADAAMAYSPSDLEDFWNIREDVGMINSFSKYNQHFDVSLPTGIIGKYVDQIRSSLTSINSITGVYAFGHLADGNIHFIVGKDSNKAQLKDEISSIIYGPLQDFNGSVSAEHGIGIEKKPWLDQCRNSTELKLMRDIKRMIDPKGILNPGRIFDI